MDFRIIAGSFTIILAVISYSLYLISIAKKRTIPHTYSWLIWSILASIGFYGQLSDKAGPGAWNTGITAVTCFIVFVVAIKYGDRKLSQLDRVLLAVALSAILVQVVAKSHFFSVTLATLAALIGFFFTIKKAYLKPNDDSWPTFCINASRNLISLFALSTVSYLTFFYPFMMMLANSSVVFVILFRRRNIR